MMTYLVIAILIFLIPAFISIYYEKNGRSGKPSTPSCPPAPKSKMYSGRIKYQRYTIKMIIRWEQLVKKPFCKIDYSNKEDLEKLLYVMNIDNMKESYTYPVFQTALSNDKIFKDLLSDIEHISIISSQFQEPVKQGDTSVDEDSSCFVSEIVSALIMEGLDAHYAMEEMELYDLSMYVQACNKKKKERMESERLWTYMSILPHVDGKKLRSAQEMYPFPWEIQEMKEKAEAEIKANESEFKKFISGELFDISKVNWNNKNKDD